MAVFDLTDDDESGPASAAHVRRACGLAPGDLVADKYRIERVVGAGGMGQVLAATHVGLGQEVAIKILLAEKASNSDSVERFLREARAAVMLKSSHVARVFDVGTTSAGLPYIVMELLTGKDLVTVLVESGALPYADAVDVIVQVCDAVAEAHAAGIIHRDLKPENFFLSEQRDGSPHVKVLDFGISKLGAEATTRNGVKQRAVTQENTVLGSPTYMSPEQVRNSKLVDERSDIWSLGVSLYELLTAGEPFGADSIPEIFVNVLTMTPVPPHQLLPEIPADLSAIVMRCLEKEPAARFQTIDELACALLRFGTGKQTFAPTWGDREKEPESRSSLVRRLSHTTTPRDFPVPGMPIVRTPIETAVLSSPAPMSLSATIAETPPKKSNHALAVALSLAATVVLLAGGGAAWWKLRRTGEVPAAASAVAPPSAEVAPVPLVPPVVASPTAAPEPPVSSTPAPATTTATATATTAPKSSPPARGARPSTPPRPVGVARPAPTTASPTPSGLPRERTSW